MNGNFKLNGNSYRNRVNSEEEHSQEYFETVFTENQEKELKEIFLLFRNENNEVCPAEILEGFDYLKLHLKYPELRKFLDALVKKYGWNEIDFESFMFHMSEESGNRKSEYGVRVNYI